MNSTKLKLHAGRFRRRRATALGAAAISTSLVLASCGGTDPTGTQNGSGVTLTLTAVSSQSEAMKALIDAYNQVKPNITINPTFAPVDQLQTALRARVGTGNAPDIHTVWPGNGSAMAMTQLTEPGLLAELKSPSWMDSVPKELRSLLSNDGKVYMWSSGMAVIGTVYNKDVFQDLGLTVPKTWGQLMDAAETLKGNGITPFALANQTPWVTQLISYAIAASTAYADNPDLAEQMLAGKKTFADSSWRTVLERYMELNERGFFNANPNGTTLERQLDLVISGEAAMAVQTSSIYNQAAESAKGRAEIGFFPFPGNDESGRLHIPAGIHAGLGVSASSDHKKEAMAFLNFAGQAKNIIAYSNALSNIPFGASAEDIKPALRPFKPYIDDGKAVPFMDQKWPNAEVQPTHFTVIQELFAGEISVGEALAKLDEAYQK